MTGMTGAITSAKGFVSRVWARYSLALREKPVRTRMASSGVLYFVGDHVAQYGIEDRTWKGDDADESFDVSRLVRMTLYGTLIFAPMGHFWLSRLERITLSTKVKTVAARVSLDSLVWAPWVGLMFPVCQGVMEGKTPSQIKTKVETVWWPTYSKAVCVFCPTQILNFTLVPSHLRMLALQSVGLCWNIFLSWSNNRTNRQLALALQTLDDAEGDTIETAAQARVDKLQAKKERIHDMGSQEQVGTRLGWA